MPQPGSERKPRRIRNRIRKGHQFTFPMITLRTSHSETAGAKPKKSWRIRQGCGRLHRTATVNRKPARTLAAGRRSLGVRAGECRMLLSQLQRRQSATPPTIQTVVTETPATVAVPLSPHSGTGKLRKRFGYEVDGDPGSFGSAAVKSGRERMRISQSPRPKKG